MRRLLLLALLLLSPASAFAQASVTLQGGPIYEDATSQQTYNFTVDLGTAFADRRIGVCSWGRKSNATNTGITSIVINSITSSITRQISRSTGGISTVGFAIAKVPTGTTSVPITVNYNATYLRAAIAVFVLDDIAPVGNTAYDSDAVTTNDPTTTSLDIRGGGVGIACAMDSATATGTWTGMTEVIDQVLSGGSVNSVHAATIAPSTKQTGQTYGVTFTANTDPVGVWVAFSGVQPNASSPTHKVTDNGSTTGECALIDPCTITRAMAIIGTIIEPGSLVNVAMGIYNQAPITPTNGGVAGHPVRFVGDGESNTRITATTTFLPASGFTKTAGRTYVYQMAFDEASLYTVDAVAQRGPLSTCAGGGGGPVTGCWTPIIVDDRQPPYTTPSGRAFTLDEPVLYQRWTNLADVDAQHCSWWHDTAANLLYVHMCHEQAPVDADNLYASRFDYGKFTFTGNADYISMENMSFEHLGASGITITTSATGIEFHNTKWLASQLNTQGPSTVLHDSLMKEMNTQGPPFVADPAGRCYSSQYGPGDNTTARSCFNDNADGDHIIVGVDGSGNTYDFDAYNVRIERGWNGLVANNHSVFDRLFLYGFGNHASRFRGNGTVVRNSTCNASQDCFYWEGNPSDNVIFENNISFQGWWFWLTTNGNPACCSDLVTGITLRKNIWRSVLTDWRVWKTTAGASPQTTADCNVYIAQTAGATVFRITPVSGYTGSDSQWSTLAEIQSNTDDEDNGLQLAAGRWNDGSLFNNFTSAQDDQLRNVSLVPMASSELLTSCGQAGPDWLYGTTSGLIRGKGIRIREN